MLSSKDIRQKFLENFENHDHKIIPSASVVPENDPTVLFNTAGMQPLVPYLLGEKHPLGKRLADTQKCIRTGDIDEVGDDSHLTFFEMLGNWSLGDYFKDESIAWSYELLTKGFGIDPKKLAVTVFKGDEDAPKDEYSAELWEKTGIPRERISFLGKEDNWWGPAGQTGPCGPDTEIFYWVGEEEFPPAGSNVETDEDNWMEIWNNVFMEYVKEKSTILIDGMYCLFDENFVFDKDLADALASTGSRVIIVTNAPEDKINLEGYNFEIFTTNHELAKTETAFYEKLIKEKSLDLDECFYVEHVQEHVDTAKKVGIKSELFTETSKSIESIKSNLFSFKKANQQNVDTGMGLERITAVLNGKKSVYDTDIFTYIIEKIESTLGVKYTPETQKGIRIIADHSRSAMIMISDGITPSNVDQGYVLRRLIRRAIREAYKLDYKGEFIAEIVEVIIENYKEVFQNVGERKDIILEELRIEEKQFLTTLEKGLKEFEKLVKGFAIAFERTGKKVTEIAGPKAFKLYDTFGFPIEMTVELAEERGLTVDIEGFKKAFEEHQAKSRAGAEKKFKGGLADDSEATTALHTATHLMLAGLRKVLGEHVHQAGSNITAERLRFDFTHGEKVTRDLLDQVEEYVNEAISKEATVTINEMDKEEAKNSGVEGSFWEKYPDIVKVYTVASEDGEVYSKELCGGPHVENTNTMGRFKIKKEEASSRGVRRIKAVLIKD